MTHLKDTDADAILEDGINPILDKMNNSATLIALGADGASVMSGCFQGVATQIKTNHPWVIYIHCAAHRLNLIVASYLSTVSEARSVSDCYKNLHKIFNVAKNREKFKDFQRQFYPSKRVIAASSLIDV